MRVARAWARFFGGAWHPLAGTRVSWAARASSSPCQLRDLW